MQERIEDVQCEINGEGHNAQFINIGMEYLVHETYRGRLVRVLIWKLDMDLPHSSSKRSCRIANKKGN